MVVGLAVLAAGWTAAWLVVAARLEAGIDDWAVQQRAAGGDARFERVSIGGFPFHWQIAVEGPMVMGPALAPWRWQGVHAEARLLPWSLHRLPLRLEGEQRLRPAPLAPELALSAEQTLGWVTLGPDGNFSGLSLALDRVRVTAPPAWDGVTAARAELAFDAVPSGPARSERLTITLHGETIALTGPPMPGFGTEIAKLDLATDIDGTWPAGPPAVMLAGWRDGGGKVEIRRLDLDWTPLQLEGSGTIKLDRQLRPQGAGTVQVRGLEEVVNGLQQAGVLKPADAGLARLILGMVTRKDGQVAGAATLKVTADNGRLAVGGVTLGQLKPLVPSAGSSGLDHLPSGLAGLDDAAADRAGAGKDVLQLLPIAPADRLL